MDIEVPPPMMMPESSSAPTNDSAANANDDANVMADADSSASRGFWPTLADFYRQQVFCDLEIRCGTPGPGICCHRLVMASVSRLFRRALTQDNHDADPGGGGGVGGVHGHVVVCLPGFSYSAVHALVEAVYAALAAGTPIALSELEAADDLADELRIYDFLTDRYTGGDVKAGFHFELQMTTVPVMKKERLSPPPDHLDDDYNYYDDLPTSQCHIEAVEPVPEDDQMVAEEEPAPVRRTRRSQMKNGTSEVGQKRKRGRPRKKVVSSSDSDDDNDDNDDENDEDFVAVIKPKLNRLGRPGRPKKIKTELDAEMALKKANCRLVENLSPGRVVLPDSLMVGDQFEQPYLNLKKAFKEGAGRIEGVRAGNHVPMGSKMAGFDFRALVGLKYTDDPQEYLGHPLAWSDPPDDQVPQQFEATCSAFKALFGFSDIDMCVCQRLWQNPNGRLASQVLTQMKYKVLQELSECSESELKGMATDEVLVQAERRQDCRQSSRAPEKTTYNIRLESDLADFDCLIVLLSRTDADDQQLYMQSCHFDVNDANQAPMADYCMKTLNSIWCTKVKLVNSPYLQEKFKTYIRLSLTKPTVDKLMQKREVPQQQCSECGEMFDYFTPKEKKKYAQHLRKHTIESFSCDCNITFKSQNHKMTHMARHHPKRAPHVKMQKEEVQISEEKVCAANIEMVDTVKNCQGTLKGLNFTSPLTSVNKIEADFFRVLIGIKESDVPGQFYGRPLAWSDPEQGLIQKQFEDSCQAFQAMFGFSDMDLLTCYKLYQKPGMPASKVVTNVKRKLMDSLAKYTEEELKETLNSPELAKAEARGECRKGLRLEHLSFDVTMDPSLGDFDDLVVLRCNDAGSTFLKVHTFGISESSRSLKKDICVRYLLDIWCTHVTSIESSYLQKAFETMTRLSQIRPTVDKLQSSKDESPRTMCTECGEMFPLLTPKQRTHFNRHKQKHQVENFTCDCNVELPNFAQRKSHMMLEHSDGRYDKCPHCPYVGPKKEMPEHVKKIHTSAVCDTCGEVFKSQDTYKTHHMNHHRIFPCKRCNFPCVGYRNFMKHKDEHDGPFYCKICHLQVKSNILLTEHVKRIHASEEAKKFNCEYCGKSFYRKAACKEHMNNAHIKKRDKECRYGCGSVFYNNSDRNKHERTRHQD